MRLTLPLLVIASASIAACCMTPRPMPTAAELDATPVAPTARAPVYDPTMGLLPDDRSGASLNAGGAGHVIRQRRMQELSSNCPKEEGALQFDCSTHTRSGASL